MNLSLLSKLIFYSIVDWESVWGGMPPYIHGGMDVLPLVTDTKRQAHLSPHHQKTLNLLISGSANTTQTLKFNIAIIGKRN